ncbi:helix-turn-helix domain-containing protein [Clostridium estertheticum]|uniref:helix-turn-helix domain-containing protein n=1 Tax=Clostridium estertheticum TaxID=238834 RepID=UPI001C0D1318|nr:helix-turn-helix transcriptional regulator [Clostridium estertheticum]MBU3186552.1 helix-turn-helix domain-containing protein [Clostridium estertheticum]
MKLYEYRILANITQQELAELTGVSKTHISKLERCLEMPSVNLLIHLSVILNTCPCKILDYHKCVHD